MLSKKTNELIEFLSDYELPEDFLEQLDKVQAQLDSEQERLEAMEKDLADREKKLEIQERKLEQRQARLDVIEEKLKERYSALKTKEKELAAKDKELFKEQNRVLEQRSNMLEERERMKREAAEREAQEAVPPFRAEPSPAVTETETKAEPVERIIPEEKPVIREPRIVPEQKPEPEAKPEPKQETEPEVKPEPEMKPEPEVKPEPKQRPIEEASPAAAAMAAAAAERTARPRPQTRPQARPQTRSQGKPKPKPQAKPQTRQKPPAKKKKKKRGGMIALILILLAVLAAAIILGFFLGGMDLMSGIKNAKETIQEQVEEAKLPDFEPAATENTLPENLIKETAIQLNDQIVESYSTDTPIDFGYGKDYTDVEGIVTFRGNNFRDTSSYGTADITEQKFGEYWEVQTGALKAPDGEVWTGSGWVGQPLMMTWPQEVRQHMNMYDWAKEAEKLTEVIYATMDGHIYFLDLETGEKTRDPMYLGYTFKGAGALDPRGYPIMYVGSGYDSTQGKSRVFIINLLDCEVMYTFGNADSFSKRGTLSYFDGSALVDAETDKLIYPGENGILYIYQLNTFYDETNGVLTVNPSPPVKWRYYGKRSGSMYLGMEDSAIVWRGHIFFTTNDGYLFCLNLNTLETVWVQDVLDDTNCTSTLELEDGHPYLYVSTSFHLGWRSSSTANVPVWKIDAENGEIVWKVEYECHSVKGNSGGVQGSIAQGKNDLADLIFVPVAKTPTVGAGFLVALNKQTGEEVWKLSSSNYSWSSPVVVYDENGKGYVCHANSAGKLNLIDGLTGEVLDSMDLGSNVEASPAVFNNKLVVGTRGCKIYGVTLK